MGGARGLRITADESSRPARSYLRIRSFSWGVRRVSAFGNLHTKVCRHASAWVQMHVVNSEGNGTISGEILIRVQRYGRVLSKRKRISPRGSRVLNGEGVFLVVFSIAQLIDCFLTVHEFLRSAG